MQSDKNLTSEEEKELDPPPVDWNDLESLEGDGESTITNEYAI